MMIMVKKIIVMVEVIAIINPSYPSMMIMEAINIKINLFLKEENKSKPVVLFSLNNKNRVEMLTAIEVIK